MRGIIYLKPDKEIKGYYTIRRIDDYISGYFITKSNWKDFSSVYEYVVGFNRASRNDLFPRRSTFWTREEAIEFIYEWAKANGYRMVEYEAAKRLMVMG